MLEDLSLEFSVGEITLFLPDGDYDVNMETNAASTTMTLPQASQQTVDLRVNAGAVTIELPEGMELRIETDQAGSLPSSQLGRIITPPAGCAETAALRPKQL